jgi:hypothetical protein
MTASASSDSQAAWKLHSVMTRIRIIWTSRCPNSSLKKQGGEISQRRDTNLSKNAGNPKPISTLQFAVIKSLKSPIEIVSPLIWK